MAAFEWRKFFYLFILIAALSFQASALGTFLTPDGNTILYYHLNQNASAGEGATLAYDYSGNQLNGTISSATFNSTGGFLSDGSYMFNGATSNIVTANSNLYNFTNGFHISLWVNSNVTAATSYRLLDRRTGNNGFILYQFGTGFSFFVGNGTANVIASASQGTIINNTWMMLDADYNGSAVRIYLNGVLQDIKTLHGFNNSPQILRICRDSAGTFCSGQLDEIMIKNVSLSTEQTWNNYMTYMGACLNLSINNNVGGNATICPQTYSLSSNGINIQADNVNLEGNGVTIISTTGATGVESNSRNNVQVRNLRLINFSTGVYLLRTNNSLATNISVFNPRYGFRIETNSVNNNISHNYIENHTGSQPLSIYFPDTISSGAFIFNNTINRSGPMSVSSSNSLILKNKLYNMNNGSSIISAALVNNITVDSNEIYGTGTNSIQSIAVTSANNSIIKNNYVEGAQQIFAYNILLGSFSRNITVINNTLLYTQYQISVGGASSDINIQNNTLKFSDQGSNLGGTNIIFSNNLIVNTSSDYDGYDIGLKLNYLKDSIINNNNFTEMTSLGIEILNSTNLTLNNNSFDFVPLNQRSKYAAIDTAEVPCAIKVAESFKSYLGGGLEPLGAQNVTYISLFDSSNIRISNSTFDADTQCYLWDTNHSVTSHDLSDFWYAKFRAPVYLYNVFELYLSNSFNNISRWYPAGVINETLTIAYNGVGVGGRKIDYKLNKTQFYFKNINTTTAFAIELYNLTPGWTVRNATASQVFFTSSSANQNYNHTINPGDAIIAGLCSESWTCTAWLDKDNGAPFCISGEQIRTCTEANLCGTTATKPAEQQYCTPQSGGGGGGGSSSNTNTPVTIPAGQGSTNTTNSTNSPSEPQVDIQEQQMLMGIGAVIAFLILIAFVFAIVAFKPGR